MNLKLYNVSPRIPAELEFLETLAGNVWWCWHPAAIQLFIRIDASLWRKVHGNAKTFLRRISQQRLEELAHDPAFLRRLNLVMQYFERDVVSGRKGIAERDIAYFSLEFGIHESIPIFSGGLGVLAGDHLKAASDMHLPIAAVGLLYRQGYFRQVLDRTGWQIEHYPVSEIIDLPLERTRDANGNEIIISIPLVNRPLYAAVWTLWVGNVPLLLLDTELPQNPPDLREVTWRLYGGDKRMRLHQELLLGIGGYKALLAAGCRPAACHMNEGHAGFMALARIADLVNNQGYAPDVALETVWRSNIFTTHTPVPAGNEVFDIDLVRPYLEVFAHEAKIEPQRVLQWGMPIEERNTSRSMSMTVFGLRMAANYSNGVSKLHGEVARNMWRHLWPQRAIDEIPIGHITNGVHAPSWVSEPMWNLYERYLPSNWTGNPNRAKLEEALAKMPDDDLWTTHEFCRQALVRRAKRMASNFTYQSDDNANNASQIAKFLNPDILTIGFARRFATYKRGTLLLRDQQRLLRLLNNTERPVQFVFAGKAHPADNEGKQLIKDLVQFAQRENVQHKLLFLENYDIGMARTLVQGVDVWLNTPRRPQEASGTSGMKAAQNGVINCSILDGWWDEAWDGSNGWAIGSNRYYTENEDSDDYDSQQLFNLLENEIIPCFYDRIGGQVPKRWIKMMKASIATGLGDFSSNRMVADYKRMYYDPAVDAYKKLSSDNAALAQRLVRDKQALVENFQGNLVRIFSPEVDGSLDNTHVGDRINVRVKVNIGRLQPEQIEVDAYFGIVDAHNEMIESRVVALTQKEHLGDDCYIYGGEIVCDTAGRFGLTARVKAAGNEWDNSVPGFMCWPCD